MKSQKDTEQFIAMENSGFFDHETFGPHVMMTGTLKQEGSTSKMFGSVPRFCCLKISRVTVLRPLQEVHFPSSFTLDICMDDPKNKKTLRSIPIDSKVLANNQVDLDFQFGFTYWHRLKPPFDRVKIIISEAKKKKNSKEYATIGFATLPLQTILQAPLDEVISVFPPKPKKMEKEERKIEKMKEKEQKQQVKKDKKGRNTTDMRDSKQKQVDLMGRKPSAGPEDIRFDDEISVKSATAPSGYKPLLELYISATSYPETVDSLQGARDWDDEFFPDPMLSEIGNFSSQSTSSHESEESEEEKRPTPNLMLSDSSLDSMPQAAPSPSMLLADKLRSRMQRTTSAEQIVTPSPPVLHRDMGSTIEKAKKLLLRKKPNKKSSGEANLDDFSLGASDEEIESRIAETFEPYVEVTPPSSPQERIIKRRSTPVLTDSSIVVLISPKPKALKLEPCFRSDPKLKNSIFTLSEAMDLASIFSQIESLHRSQEKTSDSKSTKIVMCGGDGFVNAILRAYVETSLQRQQRLGANMFQFYLVPVGGKNDLASHLASFDTIYKNQFFCREWEELFEKEELQKEQMQEIINRIHHYIFEASVSFSFHVAEAQLTTIGETANSPSVQKNIPFIKGIQIGHKENDSDLTDLSLDFWVPKKKGESHKSFKNFQYFTASHPTPATIPTSSTAQPSGFDVPTMDLFIGHGKDKNKKENIVKEILHLPKKTDQAPPETSTFLVTRLVCSVADTKNLSGQFKALIDGIEWSGIKYVTVNAQSNSRIKTLPIQHFKQK